MKDLIVLIYLKIHILCHLAFLNLLLCYNYFQKYHRSSRQLLEEFLSIGLNCTVLTFDNEFCGAACLASFVGGLDAELAGVLVESLGNVQRVELAILDNLEIRGADELGSLAVPRHLGHGLARHLHGQLDRLTLAHLLRLQALLEERRHHRR